MFNENKNKGKLITISGSPAGAVETIIKILTANHENYRTAVITTTRQRRMDEILEGLEENYCFVSREEFEKGIVEDQFIEYSFYAGNYYGTNKKAVFSQLDDGINVILEVSYETAHKIKEMYTDTIEVSVISSEADAMIQRLKEREMDDKVIRNRVLSSDREAYIALKADIVLVNQKPEETADCLVKIIENPEKAREIQAQNVECIIKMRKNIQEHLKNDSRILLLHAESSKRMERLISKLTDIGIQVLNPNNNLSSEKFNKDKFTQIITDEKNILFFISDKIATNKELLNRFFYVWEYAKKRDKNVITIVEWDSVLLHNVELKQKLDSAKLIFPEDGLHSEQDYIDVVGSICDVIKREENRQLLYDKISSLIKISYIPGIVLNISKLVRNLYEEVKSCENQAKRISIYKEIWKWIEILNKNSEQGYGEVWKKTAHERLDVMNCLSKMLKHNDFKQDDLYLIAYAVRALFVEIQIRDDCVDTITNGDIHELKLEIKVPYYERQQQLIKKLNEGIIRKGISKENHGSFTQDELKLILEAGQYYVLTKMERKVEVEKKEDSDISKDDYRLISIAEQMAQTNHIFSLISENSGAEELFKCLKTSYERLRKYSEIIGAKEICAECLEHIAEINQQLDKKQNILSKNITTESAFKALLGFKVQNSEQFDVFISYKHEDGDIARNLYLYLKQNLLYPFFDKYTLPELSNSDYEEAIMDALEKSKHFVVIISKLEYLKSFWIELEMKTFQHELNEGRKVNSNFLIIVSDEVEKQILETNKKCLNIRYRSCEIVKISEYKEKIMQYLSDWNVV